VDWFWPTASQRWPSPKAEMAGPAHDPSARCACARARSPRWWPTWWQGRRWLFSGPHGVRSAAHEPAAWGKITGQHDGAEGLSERLGDDEVAREAQRGGSRRWASACPAAWGGRGGSRSIEEESHRGQSSLRRSTRPWCFGEIPTRNNDEVGQTTLSGNEEGIGVLERKEKAARRREQRRASVAALCRRREGVEGGPVRRVKKKGVRYERRAQRGRVGLTSGGSDARPTVARSRCSWAARGRG
jgi:hypothetical protein